MPKREKAARIGLTTQQITTHTRASTELALRAARERISGLLNGCKQYCDQRTSDGSLTLASIFMRKIEYDSSPADKVMVLTHSAIENPDGVVEDLYSSDQMPHAKIMVFESSYRAVMRYRDTLPSKWLHAARTRRRHRCGSI